MNGRCQIYAPKSINKSSEPIASLIKSKFQTHVEQIAVSSRRLDRRLGDAKGKKIFRAGIRERGTERAETQCELANSLREGQMGNG